MGDEVVLRINSVQQQNLGHGHEGMRPEEALVGGPTGRWNSPVGVRGLVDDVLVGGEQQQPVLSEIHGHVGGAAASRLLLMEREARRGASPGAETAGRGGDSSGRGRRQPCVRDKETATLVPGPSADQVKLLCFYSKKINN